MHSVHAVANADLSYSYTQYNNEYMNKTFTHQQNNLWCRQMISQARVDSNTHLAITDKRSVE